ncbi:MAG: SixA phosphatase family protein [Oceanicaulis sp.]
MPTLIVMRHAKAVDRLEAEDDFERGLTERGRADAGRDADALRDAGLAAGHALVSPARRTRETFGLVRDALGDPEVTDPMALYHASTEMLERAVGDLLDKGAETIALVGHNPGVGGFAHSLAASARAAAGMPHGWPTSSLAAFEIERRGERIAANRLIMLFDPKAARA